MKEITFNSDAKLKVAALAAGISDTKMDKAIPAYGLPDGSVVTFSRVVLMEDEDKKMSHLAYKTEGGDTISASGVQVFLPLSKEDADLDFGIVEGHSNTEYNGNLFIKGSAINPGLTGNQVDTFTNKMKGKSFSVQMIERKTLKTFGVKAQPYLIAGKVSVDKLNEENQLKLKKFYILKETQKDAN